MVEVGWGYGVEIGVVRPYPTVRNDIFTPDCLFFLNVEPEKPEIAFFLSCLLHVLARWVRACVGFGAAKR